MKQQLKAVFFKTKILLIDDNDLFLNTLEYKLSENYLVSSCNDSKVALENLQSHFNEYKSYLSSDLILEKRNNEEETDCFSVDFSRIQSIADDPSRQEVVSVIVIDYSMPGMNGIEFCERISHLPVLKIMLTGHADLQMAVDAFNKGVIDVFLVKNDSNMMGDIIRNIDNMQRVFFAKQSSYLLHYLSHKAQEIILSPEYVDLFDKIVDQTQAVEYYMLDAQGSFLFVNNSKKRFYFKILFDEELDELIDVAVDLNANSNILNRMIKKTYAPIFISEADYKLSIPEWGNIVHPISKYSDYYFCLIPE